MTQSRSWTIGAAPECDVVVNEPTVSGRHCRLTKLDAGWQLTDLGSTNGTYVNGQRVDQTVPVEPSDRITLGQNIPFPWQAFTESASPGDVSKHNATPPQRAAGTQTEAADAESAADAPSDRPRRRSQTDDARRAARPSRATQDEQSPSGKGSGQGRRQSKQPSARHASNSPAPVPPPLPPTAASGAGASASGRASRSAAGSYTASPSREIRIGREADNDVVIPTPVISRYHARLLDEGGTWQLEDLGSSNGTFVGTRENRITTARVSPADTVFFGTYRTNVERLLAEAKAPERSVSTIGFKRDSIVFGRDEQCDQVLNFPMISRRHARLMRTESGFLVEDLGSSNGTFVNGQRIERPTRVRPGDTITLGSYTFQLTPDGELEQHDYRDSFTVEAREICIDVPKRRLLEHVSLTILPGEFVGLMGPSGAGKSTLMNALNGYTPPSQGRVFVNGHDLYSEYDLFRGQIGFVPQDDIVHRDLTVEQALYYSARLRLPKDFSGADIRKRITEVLQELGLEAVRKSRIGLPDRGVLSGGQRKRVNLAMELITDPSILFLDEPTSGLSSEDTLEVMKLLRKLADGGKTILLTIHQPSLEVFRQMDHLVIVAKDAGSPEPGRLAYFGPAYPDSIRFFNPPPPRADGSDQNDQTLSPDDVLRGLAKQKADTWIKRYAESPYKRDYVDTRKDTHAHIAGSGALKRDRKENGWLQWLTLCRRCLSVKLKDTVNTTILLVQAPIIAFLVVLVFGKNASKTMELDNWMDVSKAATISTFLMTLAALWFGCSNAVREIVAEWTVYRRERMVNLKIWPYVASKFTVLGGLCLLQCLVLMLIVYFGAGLRGNWFGMFMVLLIASAVGLSIGLTVSALVKTSEVAVALLPLILLPMVILGGVLQPVHDMNAGGQFFAHLMPSRWAFEGLLLLESNKRDMPEAPATPVTRRPPRDDRTRFGRRDVRFNRPRQPVAAAPAVPELPEDMADRYFPADDGRLGIAVSFVILLVMLGLFVGGIFGILRLRDIH